MKKGLYLFLCLFFSPLQASNSIDFDELYKGKPQLYKIIDPKHSDRPSPLLVGTQHNLPLQMVQKAVRRFAEGMDILVIEIVGTGVNLGDYSDLTSEDLWTTGLMNEKFRGWTKELTIKEKFLLDTYVLGDMQEKWGIDYECLNPKVIIDILDQRNEDKLCSNGIDFQLYDLFENEKKPILPLENGKDRLISDHIFEDYETVNLDRSVISLSAKIRSQENNNLPQPS